MPEDRSSTSWVERALERLQQTTPAMSGVTQAFLVGITALLGLFDVLVVGVSFGAGGVLAASYWAVASVGLAAASVVAVVARRANLLLSLTGLCVLGVAVTSATVSGGHAGVPSFAVLFAIATLTLVAIRIESVRAAAIVSVIGLIGVVSEATRLNNSLALLAIITCVLCFSVAVAVGVYLRWSDWRRITGEAAARTDERLEIARELHDLVGHYVTAMVVQAQAARHVADRDPTAAADALGRIEAAGGEAMAAMRRMVGGLRDDAPIAPGAVWDDIEDLVSTAAADGLPARLRMDPAVRDLSADLSASAFRIVTESLTNVRRHARDATRVDVDLQREATLLRIRVADDGTAVGVAGHGTYGLVGMSERADALGGTLYAGPSPAPSRGWLVVAELPLGRAS